MNHLRRSLLILAGLSILAAGPLFADDNDGIETGNRILLLYAQLYGPSSFNVTDYLELNGWQVTTAGVEKTVRPCASFGRFVGMTAIEVDVLVSEITDVSSFHCVAVMPSSRIFYGRRAFDDFLQSKDVLRLLKQAGELGIPIYASCSGVRVLAAADVIDGRKVCGELDYQFEYESAGARFLGNRIPPVVDGNIITATRGSYFKQHIFEAIAAAAEEYRKGLTKSASPPRFRTAVSDVDLGSDAIWAKAIGGAPSEGCRSVRPATDGGFILAGYTYSPASGGTDLLVVKTDADGRLQWLRPVRGAGTEYGNAVIETKDGGFAVVGFTTSVGAGGRDVYLVRLDNTGNPVWEKTYGGTGSDIGTAVIELPSGDFVISGYTDSSGAGQYDAYLLKLDSTGAEVWSKTFGGAEPDMSYSLCQAADGGFMLFGTSASRGTGNMDYYLVKTDAQGNLLWERSYDKQFVDWGNSMIETSDGNYLLVGDYDKRSGEVDILDAYVVKVDPEGNEIWSTALGASSFYDHGNAAVEMPDGGFLICGATKTAEKNVYDLFLARLAADGKVVWKKSLGGDSADWALSACLTASGEVVLAGHTDSFGEGGYEMLLLKLDLAEGN